MFLNIMYYDLSNQAEMSNSTNSISLTFGSLYITPQQVCSLVSHISQLGDVDVSAGHTHLQISVYVTLLSALTLFIFIF
jgi:hypothetical protein